MLMAHRGCDPGLVPLISTASLTSTMISPLVAQASGLQGIAEAHGFSIAITGMLIVFVALSLITLCVAKLPVVLEALDPWLPELEPHGPPTPAEQLPRDEEQIVAAIGYALHNRGSG